MLAEVLPQYKVDEARRPQGDGRVVAMVGDGANLAPILQNLSWAFACKVVLILVATLGPINPIPAGAARAFSSVSVVSNSLRSTRFGRPSRCGGPDTGATVKSS